MTKILAESLEEFRSNRDEELNEAIAISAKDFLKLFLKAPEHRKASDRFKAAFKWQLEKIPSLEAEIDALSTEAKVKLAQSGLAWLKEHPSVDNLTIPYEKDVNNALVLKLDEPVRGGASTSSRGGVHGGTSVKQ